MSWSSNEVHLASRPTGYPDAGTWSAVTVEVPEPGEGQFVVKVDHISLDPAMRGWLNDVRSYIPPVQIGEAMRAMCTGSVVASRHPDFAVGDAVAGTFGVVEYALSDGTGVTTIDLGVAAAPTWLGALGMTGMTAYFGLHDVGRIKAGETVLVSAAAGAVGSVVAQLAKAEGCRVIGIAGGPDKVAWLKEIGLDEAIDYKSENVLRRLREIAPKGIDVYFDNVGGAILEACISRMKPHGVIACCGMIATYNDATPTPGPSNLFELISRRIRMEGFLVMDFGSEFATARAALEGWMNEGKLKAFTDVQEGFENIPKTFLRIFSGANIGKQTLKVADPPLAVVGA